MKTADLINILVHAIEQAEPEAVFGRLNPDAVGFRVQLDGDLWIVRVEEPRPVDKEDDDGQT